MSGKKTVESRALPGLNGRHSGSNRAPPTQPRNKSRQRLSLSAETAPVQQEGNGEEEYLPILPQSDRTDEDIHHLINIWESKYTHFKKSNIMRFAKDKIPELFRRVSISLTYEPYTFRQVEGKIRYMKTRYETVYAEYNGTGF